MSATEQCGNMKFCFTPQISIRKITNAWRHVERQHWRKRRFMSDIFVMAIWVSMMILEFWLMLRISPRRAFCKQRSVWDYTHSCSLSPLGTRPLTGRYEVRSELGGQNEARSALGVVSPASLAGPSDWLAPESSLAALLVGSCREARCFVGRLRSYWRWIFGCRRVMCWVHTDLSGQSQSESELLYNWRSVSQYVLVSSPISDFWPEIFCCCCCWKLQSCLIWGALSDERSGLSFVSLLSI
jgi:hypothetical protein